MQAKAIKAAFVGMSMGFAASLAACDAGAPWGLPQGGIYPPDGQAAVTPVPQPAPPAAVRSVTVKPGDSLYAIAKANKLPLRLLIEANRLSPPFVLHPGQQLLLPQAQTIIVANGDSIDSIARRYGVESTALVRANEIKPPYKVHLGQILVLPPRADSAMAVASNGVSPLASPPGVAVAPLPTPSSSTRSPSGVQVQSLAPPPGITENKSGPMRPLPPTTAGAPATRPSSPPSPPAVASVPAPPPSAPPASEDAQNEEAPTARFLWPIRGTVVSGFGAKEGGLFNDGINIAAARGQPVRAAADGVVAYVGNEIRGFGNLVLVKHPDGWITAYAHADQILVKRGDRVRRGETIATVGASGNVASPQLHFELRRGAHAVDPTKYLPTLAASSE
jgi:murein DD-endopeptidase MepM/ murein hydrolase activator NlpD